MTVAALLLLALLWAFSTITVFQIVRLITQSNKIAWLAALALTPVGAAFIVLPPVFFGSAFGF